MGCPCGSHSKGADATATGIQKTMPLIREGWSLGPSAGSFQLEPGGCGGEIGLSGRKLGGRSVCRRGQSKGGRGSGGVVSWKRWVRGSTGVALGNLPEGVGI